MSLPPLRRQDMRAPTWQGEARPGVLQPAAAGEVPAADAAASASLARRLEQLAATTGAIADREAVETAWEAGTQAGEAAPGTLMEGGGTLFRTAFNRAAVDTAARRLEITARERLQQLAEAHPADPEAFNGQAQAYRDSLLAGLPERIRPVVAQRFDAMALPVAQQVREGLRRRVADDALATFQAALPGRIADIERAAGQAVADPQAARALAVLEDQTVAELVALGPREAFRIGNRQYPADPSRAGALSAADVARQMQAIERARTEAAVVAAWRQAGGGLGWIAEFERRAAGSEGFAARQAAQGRMRATPEALAARVPEAWRPIAEAAARENNLPPGLLLAMIGLESGGRADAVSPAGAVGPAQILPSTARDPGLPGVPPLPEEALRDPARAIPWAARYLAALREQFGGDLGRALAAYNAGLRRVAEAERGDRALPRETQDYLATLLPAAGPAGALPQAEVARIGARLRALHAADQQATAEGRAEARADLSRRIAENLAAIGVSGQPVHRLTEAEISAAGLDPAEVLNRERLRMEVFAADRIARSATDPAALAELAAQFAPGTPGFSADPQAAAALLRSLEARGVQVRHAALAERIRDLTVEAQATGQAPAITAEEGLAAGLRPEQVAAVNRDLAQAAEITRLRSEAARLPPDQREAALAALPLTGPDAARNAERVRALSEAFAARDRAVAQDAAAYAMAGSEALRALGQQVAGGDWAVLPEFVRRLRAEQEVLGIPAGQQRDLPKPFAEAIFQRIANSVDLDGAWAALVSLNQAVGPAGVQRLAAEWRPEGDRKDDRRRAIAVAAALSGQDQATARDILRGAFVLRDNAVPDATRTNVDRAVEAHVGAALALRPDALADVKAATLAAVAARRAAEGRLTTPIGRGEYAEVLERIIPVTTYGGQRVVLPPGMAEQQFQGMMAALPPERLQGAQAADGRPITPEMIARGGFTLQAVGPGRYLLRYGTRDVLDVRPGAAPDQAFVLDLNGAEPTRPGAGRQPLPDRLLEEEARRRRQGAILRPVDAP